MAQVKKLIGNVKGPEGAKGDPGPQGPEGPKGDPGPAGESGTASLIDESTGDKYGLTVADGKLHLILLQGGV